MTKLLKKLGWLSVVLGLTFSTATLQSPAAAQDQYQDQDQGDQQQQDDPPSRVARLGYMEGSVSFQPAGEPDWVQAVANRPMTTGDKLWADKDSRAELQLGSAVIRLNSETGFSFLNLDDDTVQIELTAGSINLRVRRLDQNDSFEIDTPNLAFSVTQAGNYRVEASEDGTYTVVSVSNGGGEATGNGQTYTLHEGQRGTFSGTDSLNAEVTEIGGPDQFDTWASGRDRRYDNSRSAQYMSRDVVGYEDLDDYGDWRDDSNYGHVWYPSRVESDWAPYRDGHWVWISPWGYTWVDDSPWGYAPFHYGRWVVVSGRWGWIAGPIAVRPVYAPALVVFIGGGGVGVGFGGNVGWFPLGPREVYVPSYRVSRGYVNRVNISNTTVNNVQITNVYNTTIVNKTTNITNVTYVNRNVRGAVTAVPQRTFVDAQPVRRAVVRVNEQQIARASLTTRVSVTPTRESVLGARANTAGRVTAPPRAVMNRQVIAKKTPPPPPVPFARQQKALEAHPGQPLARSEVRNLRPAANADTHPMVKQAPPGRAATPNQVRPGNQPNAGRPGNQPNQARPGQQVMTPPANQPGNRPGNQQAPGDRPGAGNQGQRNQPDNRPDNNRPDNNRPAANQPDRPNRPDNNRPDNNRPNNNRPNNDNKEPSANQPNQPDNRPEPNRPANRPDDNRPNAAQPNQPTDRAEPNRPPRNDRPQGDRPNNRPDANQPTNRPQTDRPLIAPKNDRPNRANDQPDTERPQANRPAETPRADTPRAESPRNDRQSDRPAAARPNDRPDRNRPDTNRPEPRDQPTPRATTPNDRPQRTPPAETRQAPDRPQPRAQTPAEKKQDEKKQQQEDERKKREKPPGE